MRYLKGLLFGVVCCLIATVVWAGNTDSPAAPTSADSAMYTLEDIYNRLNLARVSELLSSDRNSYGLSVGWQLPCLTLKRDILLAKAKDLHHLILKL